MYLVQSPDTYTLQPLAFSQSSIPEVIKLQLTNHFQLLGSLNTDPKEMDN